MHEPVSIFFCMVIGIIQLYNKYKLFIENTN